MTWGDIIRNIEEKYGDVDIAIRFTNNPDDDARRGVSYLGWGIAPEDTEEECLEEHPEFEAFYDESAGGWLPALPGLCGFHGDVESAMDYARSWSFSDAYRFVMVGPARLVRAWWDCDLVEFKDFVVFDNPDY